MGLFDFFRRKLRPDPKPEPKPEPKSEARPSPSAAVGASKPAPAPGAAKPAPAQASAKPAAPQAAAKADAAPAHTGVYKDVQYAMRYDPASDVYIIEFHDATGIFLQGGLEFMLGNVIIAGFALTKDEFELCNGLADGQSSPALDDVIGRLLANVPNDRIYYTFQWDPLTDQRKPMRLGSRCPSMDGGAYQKYRKERAIAHLRALEKVWVIIDRTTGESIPMVDQQGFAWVMEREDFAKKILLDNPTADLTCKAFDRDQFAGFVRWLYALGIIRFRLNPGVSGVYGEIDRDEYLPDPLAKKWDYYGSSLNQMIIRYRQASVRKNPAVVMNSLTYWNAICHSLPNTVLLAPVRFDGDPDAVEDDTLHLSEGALRLLAGGSPDKPQEAPIGISDDGRAVGAARIDLFYGGEGYRFAPGSGQLMHLRTVVNQSTVMLCAFTDFAGFNALFRGKARVGAFSYDELLRRLDDRVSGTDNPIAGIVVNPGTSNLVLDRASIEKLNAERSRPPRIVI